MAENLPSRGPIGVATLPAVVRDLWRTRASGTLHLQNGGHTKRIMFMKGEIVFAATNVETERLGERLVRAGKIKRSVLELSFRVMERSHERTGTTMVEWGWVSPLEMRRAVAAQIKEIIYSVFRWASGEYRFEPAEKPTSPDLVLELKTAEVIYEGALRMSDLTAIRAGIGTPSGILTVAEGMRLGIPVTQEDGYIIARADGRFSVLDIVGASPLAEEETLRRIYALLLAGILDRKETPSGSESRFDGELATKESTGEESADEKKFRDALIARHAAMKFGDLYDRLGVVAGSPDKRIREAYEEVLRSLEPDASFRHRVEDLRKRMGEVRAKVDEAYEVLGDPDRRRDYDRSASGISPESTVAAETLAPTSAPPLPRPKGARAQARGPARPGVDARQEAELHYLEANRFWQAGDYFDAVASMNEAVRLDPEKASYHRVLGRWLAENPSCAEAAREHLERAISLDPGDREAHLGLARLFETEGLAEKARGIYEKLASSPTRVSR
jgi:tetratricopeptide (TPR) repeat protein